MIGKGAGFAVVTISASTRMIRSGKKGKPVVDTRVSLAGDVDATGVVEPVVGASVAPGAGVTDALGFGVADGVADGEADAEGVAVGDALGAADALGDVVGAVTGSSVAVAASPVRTPEIL